MQPETPQHAQAVEATGLALAVCLTVIAGYVDATAFMRFGGLFVSFVSGNSTKLAALPSLGRASEAAVAGGAVVLFVMGAFAGRLVHEAAGAWRRPALLSLTAALLALATVAGMASEGTTSGSLAFGGAIAAMALAMGVMNAVLKRVGDTQVAATYVTGVLVHLGQALADRAMGQPSPWAIYLLNWLSLVLGAAVGAIVALHVGLLGLILPTASAALLALVDGDLVRRAQAAQSRP